MADHGHDTGERPSRSIHWCGTSWLRAPLQKGQMVSPVFPALAAPSNCASVEGFAHSDDSSSAAPEVELAAPSGLIGFRQSKKRDSVTTRSDRNSNKKLKFDGRIPAPSPAPLPLEDVCIDVPASSRELHTAEEVPRERRIKKKATTLPHLEMRKSQVCGRITT